MRATTVLHVVEIAGIVVLWRALNEVSRLFVEPMVLGRGHGEMLHPQDRASIAEWGHAG